MATNNEFKLSDELVTFLKQRNITDAFIEVMESNKIDEDAIINMRDCELKAYLPCYGDRIATKGFCERRRNPRGDINKRSLKTIIDDYKSFHIHGKSNKQEKKPKPKPQKKNSVKHGLEEAKVKELTVRFGWFHMTFGSVSVHVPKKKGGGSQMMKLPETAAKAEMMEAAKSIFFKDGKVNITVKKIEIQGEVDDFDFNLVDYRDNILEDSMTVRDYYNALAADPERKGNSRLKVFLQTKDKIVKPTTVRPKRKRSVFDFSDLDDSDLSELDPDEFLADIESRSRSKKPKLEIKIQDSDDKNSDDNDSGPSDNYDELRSIENTKKIELKENDAEVAENEIIGISEDDVLHTAEMNDDGEIAKKKIIAILEDDVLHAMTVLHSKMNDESQPKEKNDESQPKEINDESIPKEMNDESIPKEMNDESIPKEMNDESIPKEMNDESQPREITNEIQPREITNEIIVLETATPASIPVVDLTDADTSAITLTLHRTNIFSEMMDAFQNIDNIENKLIRIEMINKHGEIERGQDDGGIFRDAMSYFWDEFKISHTTGAAERLPVIKDTFGKEKWYIVSKILLKGYSQGNYFPVFFSKLFIRSCIFKEEHFEKEEILNSLFLLQESATSSFLKDCINNFDKSSEDYEEKEDELTEILAELQASRLPKNGKHLQIILEECAHVMIIQKPMFIIDTWRILLENMMTVDQLNHIYTRSTPTARNILKLIPVKDNLTKEEDKAVNYLRKFIRNCSLHLREKFLWFSTGANMVAVEKIGLIFNKLKGFERRFIAHTCGPALEVPLTFNDEQDFCATLTRQLESGFLEMDIQ